MIDQHKYGNLLLDVVALQVQTGGGIDTIISLIDEIIADLNHEQAQADQDFHKSNDTCNDQTTQLSNDISDAEDKIAEATAELEDNLKPHREQLDKDLAEIDQRIQENRDNRETAIEEREADHEKYYQRAIDFSDAIASCNEALGLLSQLKNNPETATSLLESHAVSKAMETISARYKHMHNGGKFGPMIDALVELSTSQNFTNQETLAEVIRLIEELRQEFIDSQREEQEWEDEAQSNHVAYIESLDSQYDTLIAERNNILNDIIETNTKISTREDEVKSETEAKESNEKALAELLAYCATTTNTYETESKSRSDELEILAAVRVIFVDLNADLEDYMRERVDADFAEAEESFE